ncbi:hypothetical protein NDK50_12540 [Paraburkholderia bryophila]|uniref:hypothetical protein n=1 Tax=Paraburkholderia bryophila TaxID=420952 RepID=UPI0023495CD2|nr:hypothetical protein [Paraburkholderia bryophila]WCM18296.1 hypothetical protein NDK50_12540 [Paraburkholderia bryophila]
MSILIDQVLMTPDVGMFFSTAAMETGERLDVLIERVVRPFHDVFVPLLAEAIYATVVPQQDPEIMFMLLVNGIGKTVSYSRWARFRRCQGARKHSSTLSWSAHWLCWAESGGPR